METVKLEFEQGITTNLTEWAQNWRIQLSCDFPEQSYTNRESIVSWLLGDLERFEKLNPSQLEIAQQAIAYRYRILQQRYLGLSPEKAYRQLTTRLSSLVLVRNKIRTWISLSRDRSATILDVLQEVLQELLQSDRYMQQQTAGIAKYTKEPKLRNALLFATMEEYCLRPVRNQPLIVYRFVNYLRRISRGGVTQVPSANLIRLVSEEILTDDSENPLKLLDSIAVSQYQDTQAVEEQQLLRNAVKQQFSAYLEEHLGTVATQWLQLYLQGKSQEAIALSLNMPIKDVYRLREKISYHAVRVFALKDQPELVNNWLETSLQEHSFGLTPQQWQKYYKQLTPQQRQVIKLVKAGKNTVAIAAALNVKTNQIMAEWSKLYLLAQALRSQGREPQDQGEGKNY